jgi:hypothetical protein
MKILQSYTFTKSAIGARKHPWTEWLDGQIRELEPKDFEGARVTSIATQARSQAKKRGMLVQINKVKATGGLVIRAFKPAEQGVVLADPKLTDDGTTATKKKGGRKKK